MNITVKHPADCLYCELDKLATFAAYSGEVELDDIKRGVRNAKAILWVAHQGAICAVAVLKRPNVNYRKKIFQKANFSACPETYTYELGYIFVDSANRKRGLAKSLVTKAIEVSGEHAVYATTRSDNSAMQNILTSFKFVKVGDDYKSKRTKSLLSLLTYKPTQV
ncbi:N-acetyltransferase family protein [Hyphococcus sp.]|uniref:GNAT family N-acetyltransferase n=1 Tax=Hyphococcus sp. TaxID=2038636 RepID=UPI003CCB8C15